MHFKDKSELRENLSAYSPLNCFNAHAKWKLGRHCAVKGERIDMKRIGSRGRGRAHRTPINLSNDAEQQRQQPGGERKSSPANPALILQHAGQT